MSHMTTMSGDGSPAAAGSSRWNPTKEQISMLESLYRQGIRTPSAEQIQEITSRLKVYGHIEGKNVFYWFQNHKARQRQKQKQENNSSMAFYNRFLHKPAASPFFPPPCPNVVCGPYYIPPKLLVPSGGGIKRTPYKAENFIAENTNHIGNATTTISGYHSAYPAGIFKAMNNNEQQLMLNCASPTARNSTQETLALFPQHPTGILQGRTATSSTGSLSSFENMTACNDGHEGSSYDQHTFFDFFWPGK
ncbi:hypothetical protein RJ639_034111 [Escallonia herrerae]|uniref:Homeobox domain-containing protein n=1 Tax=Escallonia herrerae TaxID=1293975 RepID=A0AA89BER6_9ASTE|nr:hypothetical protein RJ639_034111 [Escallonia herrerae]